MERLKLATMWLGGCSGCHMSFLDLDEFLIDLAGMAVLVYTPLVDVKVFPENVDVTLVEGAVGNIENIEQLKVARARSKFLIAFGDCAVTGNVTAMRDPLGGADVVMRRSYLEGGDLNARIPASPGVLPTLLDRVSPIHAFVPVDAYIPGCPPPAPRIREVLEQLVSRHAVRLAGADLKLG
ncbi:MAG: oxidoreductase [Isosphaeraceae bacterium]